MPRPSCTRLWGPVQEARAREVGALAAATSVLIEPNEVNEDLEAALRERSSPYTCCRYQGTRPRRSEYGFQRAAFCTTLHPPHYLANIRHTGAVPLLVLCSEQCPPPWV